MPEGLAEAIGENDLVNLLAFLTTLRQPVSIVGQFQAVGPLSEAAAKAVVESNGPVDTAKPITDGTHTQNWRRLAGDAEGLFDLSPFTGEGSVLLTAPVVSAVEQKARLVIDSKAKIEVRLGGDKLSLASANGDGPRSIALTLHKGVTPLLILAPAGSALVATFVADRPLEFVSLKHDGN